MFSKVKANKSVDILLVGKTGHGKSATGNTIVGYDAFTSTRSFASVTKSAQFEFAEFEGTNLKIVDGPGIGDTCLNTEEAGKMVIDAMTFAVALNPAGYNAIVIVANCDVRYTKEEMEVIRLLKEIFGGNFIRDHGILLMTHGDSFLTGNEAKRESFEEWIRHQTGEIQDLLKECNGRVILFNNRADANGKKEQIRKLLSMVDKLSANGQRYTSKIFKDATETRNRLLRDSKKIQLSDESLMECGLITQALTRVNFDEPENALRNLECLLIRTDRLRQGIREHDKGSKQLSRAMTLGEQLRKEVDAQIKDVKESLRRIEQMAQREAELQIKSMRLEAEENKRKEEKFKHQKEMEQQIAREEELKKQLDKEKAKNKRLQEEKEKNKRLEEEKEKNKRLEEDKKKNKRLEEEREKNKRLEEEREKNKRLEEEREKNKRLEEEREKNKRLEEEREKNKRLEKDKKKSKRLEEEREKNKRLEEEKEKDRQRNLEEILIRYREVRQEDSWVWGDVANALAGPVAAAVRWWWQK